MATAASVEHQQRTSSLELLPPSMSELRVVLLGNSWSQRRDVGNVILGEKVFSTEEPDCCLSVRGRCRWKETVLINLPDLLHPKNSEDKLTEFIEHCVRLSDPGPHVFLLVLQPEDFTEEHRLRICRVLELFSHQSFDRSLVLISASREESSFENFMKNPSFRDLIRECRYRYLFQKNLERSELLTRFSQIIKENNREYLSCEDAGLTMKPTLSDDEIQLERIQKEKEDEMKEEEENLRSKHHQEQTEQERKLTEKQLKEKDECINKERELRKKEESQKQEWRRKAETAEKKLQSEKELRENAERKLEMNKKEREEDEKRRKKEESQKQEWRRKVETAEKRLQSEREQKENAERRLEMNRKEMNRQRDAWDRERKEIYERIHQESREVLEEERSRNRKLQEEFYQKRKKWMYYFFGLLFVIFSSLFYLFLSGGLTQLTE